MTPDEILEVDARRNYPPGVSAGNLRAQINRAIRAGGHLVQQGDTLIIFNSIEGGGAEFHCFNADTPTNLADNVMAFWRMLKQAGFEYAVTPYENPKITELLKLAEPEFHPKVTKKAGRFEARVEL